MVYVRIDACEILKRDSSGILCNRFQLGYWYCMGYMQVQCIWNFPHLDSMAN